MKQYLIDYIMSLTDSEPKNIEIDNPWSIKFYNTDDKANQRKLKIIGSRNESMHQIALRLHERFKDFPMHSHNYFEMMYICSGKITHIIDGKEIELSRGDFIILNKNTKHAIKKTSAEDIGINIIISTALFESTIEKLYERGYAMEFISHNFRYQPDIKYLYFKIGEILPIENLMENLIYSLYVIDSVDDEIFTQTLSLILLYLSKHPQTLQKTIVNKANEKFNLAVDKYINNNYVNASLTELSKELSLSSAYVSRKVNHAFGMNFKDLQKEYRLNNAARMLHTTNLSIGEIIISVGYENTSYFHREFKKMFNMTPNEYRKAK